MSNKILVEGKLNTLVIGGAGFIGLHLLPILIEAGRNVTVLGRRNIPLNLIPSSAAYVVGDFGNLELIRKLLDYHDEVIYMAHATVPNTLHESPHSDLLQNLLPSIQLLSEIASRNIKLILISSGGTVYGEASTLPIQESHLTKPISQYGVTKLTLENYAYLYSITHNLRYVCVRPSNAYGIGQYPFLGQGFISTAMATVMLKKAIKIFGHNGTTRDYIYVSDVAAGIASVLFYGSLSTTYNLGSGHGFNNKQVVDKMTPILEDYGFIVNIETLPERSFDVKTNILDSSLLQLHTKWEPKISFEDGLRMTGDWLRSMNG